MAVITHIYMYWLIIRLLTLIHIICLSCSRVVLLLCFLHTRISRCTDASMFLPWNSYDTAEGSGVGLVVCSEATLGFNRIKHLSNGITGSVIKAPCGKTAGNTFFLIGVLKHIQFMCNVRWHYIFVFPYYSHVFMTCREHGLPFPFIWSYALPFPSFFQKKQWDQ